MIIGSICVAPCCTDRFIFVITHSLSSTAARLIEHVMVALLHNLYKFSHSVSTRLQPQTPLWSQGFQFGQSMLTAFMDMHQGQAIGSIKIHQIVCWKSSLLVKLGCVFPEGMELQELFVKVFVAIANQSSLNCIASDAMLQNMQRLIVSDKG